MSRDDSTSRYYIEAAAEFYASTVGVDMRPLQQRFLAQLPPGAAVLDAGCGSGRDARAFAEQGCRVSAFDASPALAELAARHSGVAVAVRRFQDVDEVACYDGIWCCASLLHVPAAEMAAVLARLWRALRPGGCLYLSFKHGQGERQHHGRHFTDADEPTLRAWLAPLPGLLDLSCWLSEDRRPDRTETWLNALVRRAPLHRLITGGASDHLLSQLSAACAQASQADLAVAFVQDSGLDLLWADLQALLQRHGRLRLLTSDYLGITAPAALRRLQLLQEDGAEVRVHQTSGHGSFHLKAYLFARVEGGVLVEGSAFVGSSNISKRALQDGMEWNYRIVHPGDAGFLEVRRRFDELFEHPQNQPLSDAWISAYEQRRQPPKPLSGPAAASVDELEAPPEPTPVQQQALAALQATRAQGYRRGLVVLATGLGKTWLAAFDARQFGAQRVLFVAHRDEILAQAARTFLRIRPQASVGSYTGRSRDMAVEVLCASVQTLGRREHLARFAPQHFDYVVVDEFHHAAARSYRDLIEHFKPAFLLGLTATPERTDQSDILSLCDDNLVYRCALFDGIRAGLLAPFHYHGILDESVSYQEIPWRNGRFDPEQLDSRLATLARARHVLREWHARRQLRTLAFCVSRRHADFMAAQFSAAGISAAAVYIDSRLGRAEALEQLQAGTLQVLFSVDLFNEGVDLPAIDTVLMLRPTESKVLFLQQLGRGLRRSPDKSHLVVLDFIGNHRAFLRQPQALFGIEPTQQAMTRFALQVEQQRLDLPPGCLVNYDLRIIDFLKALQQDGPRQAFEALRDVLGHRPTLSEYYRAGHSLAAMRRQYGHWFGLLASLDELESAELQAAHQFEALLREVETGSTAHLRFEGTRLALSQSVPPELTETLDNLLQELLGYRYACHQLSRANSTGPSSRNVAPPAHSNVELPYFPDLKIACGHFKTGRTDVAEYRPLPPSYGTLDPARHFIARAAGHSMDGGKQPIRDGDALLLELISPSRAGSITGSVVVIERQDDSGDAQYLLRHVIKDAANRYILKAHHPDYADLPASDEMRTLARLRQIIDPLDMAVGQPFMREDIPALFGEVFNTGSWHSGHVVLNEQKAHILLVTLNKQGKASSHRYVDHWIDARTFHWQSQNATTPESKRGQELIHHAERGIALHLFVREHKLSAGKSAPFVYHGQVSYRSHQGSRPMSVVFEL